MNEKNETGGAKAAPTDKTTKSRRTTVPEGKITDALRLTREKLYSRLEEKGRGKLASRHEVLGSLAEEYDELLEAVRSGTLREVEAELLDIAVGAVFGVACIRAGLLEW